MRKFWLVCVLAVTVAAMAWMPATPAAAAGERGLAVGGVKLADETLYGYAYAEVNVHPSLSVAVDYYPRAFSLGGWWGRDMGFYGEINWDPDDTGSPRLWEVGVWASMEPTSKTHLFGWVGAATDWNGSRTWLTLNADARFDLTDPLFIYVAAGNEILDGESKISGAVGLGFYF